VFTIKEKEKIKEEFEIKANTERKQIDTENTFTEQSIDRTINELTKNISSKSIILAPFNTTLSEFDDDAEENENINLPNKIKDKRIIKFGPNIKEIDKQYEKNNNGEMDNGVYNKNDCSSENSDINILDPFNDQQDNSEGGLSERVHKKSKNKDRNQFLSDLPLLIFKHSQSFEIGEIIQIMS